MSKGENKNCFVIMPIADCDGYEKGHFAHVYDDIIKPAIDKTEFTAIRADEVKETNFIHLDILKKLIDDENRADLEKDRDDEEFMAMYEQYEA